MSGKFATIKIAAVSAVIVSMLHGFAVAQVSQEFLGVWLSAPPDGDSSICSKSDWELNREFGGRDGLINVTRQTIGFWESSCKVSSFRLLGARGDLPLSFYSTGS
jgi:hypothetical protein